MKTNGKRADAAPMIGFRLGKHHSEKLEREALRLGTSVGKVSRSFVITVLDEKAQIAALSETMTTMRDELSRLRRDLAAVAEVLLYGAGKVDDKEAIKWVDENIRSK